MATACRTIKPLEPDKTKTSTTAPADPPSAEAPIVIAPPTPVTVASPAPPTVPAAPGTGPITPSHPHVARPRAGNVQSSGPSTPAKSIPIPAEPSTPRPPPVAASAAAPSPPAAVPDLAALEQRLRDTHAIGVFTKLSLKNQVDDLLERFRSTYRAQIRVPTPDLRQRYDLLLLKVVTLLQDDDPALARAIDSSREALWSILSDPVKFAKIQL